jgi:hypothetical protein
MRRKPIQLRLPFHLITREEAQNKAELHGMKVVYHETSEGLLPVVEGWTKPLASFEGFLAENDLQASDRYRPEVIKRYERAKEEASVRLGWIIPTRH